MIVNFFYLFVKFVDNLNGFSTLDFVFVNLKRNFGTV